MALKTGDRKNRLGSFLGNDRANVAIMMAIYMPVAIALLALGVDTGALYLERREAQSLADLAAIVAVSDVANAEKNVRRFLNDNNVSDFEIRSVDLRDDADEDTDDPPGLSSNTEVLLEGGLYVADPAIVPENRFSPGKAPVNAIRVTIRKPGALYFGNMFLDSVSMEVNGTAQNMESAAFWIGSRLASLDGGIANALLNNLFGTNVSFAVMDYRALLDAEVALFPMLDTLATEARLTALTYDELLDTDVSLAVLAKALKQSGHSSKVDTLLSAIAASAGARDRMIRIGDLVQLGYLGRYRVGEGGSGMIANVNAWSILTAAASLANGSQQVHLDLGAEIPGVGGFDLYLAIGEPAQGSPWLRIGEEGTTVTTAQTRLLIDARIGGSGLLSSLQIRLPIYVEVARGQATLDEIRCSPAGSKANRVVLAVRPGIARAEIGSVDPDVLAKFDRSPVSGDAVLIQTLLARVKAKAVAEVTNLEATDISFSAHDIEKNRVKSISTTDPTQSLTKSLLNSLEIRIEGPLLSLSTPAAAQAALAAAIAPVASQLDQAINTILTLVGVRLGEADVSVSGLRCANAVLVQ
ncbi:MAG: hypothetical protein KDJ80_05270 [Nitratireductor sp.]|nr:hypothetical protein [Nitratireductor sp.]